MLASDMSTFRRGAGIKPADVDMEEGENPPPAMHLDLPDMDELFRNGEDQKRKVKMTSQKWR